MNQPLWNQQRVIAAIQDRHQRGLPLTGVWRDWQALYRAAQRNFGSWQNAKLAAGLVPSGRTRWSPDRVLAEIHVWYREPAGQRTDVRPALAKAAAYYFGSWSNAVTQAGFPPRRSRTWTADRVIAAIQNRHVRGLPVGKPGPSARSLVVAGRYYFGNWRKALAAAGLEHCYPTIAAPRRWTKALVIKEIQAAHERGTPVGTIWKTDPTLYSAAKKQFGRWQIALQAAGFRPTRRTWNREAIVAKLRERYRRGDSLSSHDPENRNLAVAAYWYWGSWSSAKAAAGVGRTSQPQRDATPRKAG